MAIYWLWSFIGYGHLLAMAIYWLWPFIGYGHLLAMVIYGLWQFIGYGHLLPVAIYYHSLSLNASGQAGRQAGRHLIAYGN